MSAHLRARFYPRLLREASAGQAALGTFSARPRASSHPYKGILLHSTSLQAKENPMQSRIRSLLLFALAVIALGISTTVQADEVTDWNQILFQSAITDNTLAVILTRNAAIVQASVFDAVNGVERRYTPIHVTPDAPHGASARAAAVQAAYASLLRLYPTQPSTFDAARATSLAAILSTKGGWHEEHRLQQAVDLGLAWGQQVADAIWASRSTDGVTPTPAPFTGGTNVGQWRATPPAVLSDRGFHFRYITPC